MSTNLPALIEQHQEKFITVMSDPSKFDKMRNLFESQISKNPKLASCSPASLMGALKQIAALDIDLSTNQNVYLIPYSGECSVVVSYLGLIEIAMKSGAVKKIYSEMIFEDDDCEVDLSEQVIKKHIPGKDRKNIVGGYCIAVLANDQKVLAYMSKSQLDEAKGRAKTKQFWQHYESMAKKTLVKKALKLIPKVDLGSIDKPAVEVGKESFNLLNKAEILEAESADIFGDEE